MTRQQEKALDLLREALQRCQDVEIAVCIDSHETGTLAQLDMVGTTLTTAGEAVVLLGFSPEQPARQMP